MDTNKTAILHRMVMETHTCPYGIKAKWLLERNGFQVDDRWLTTREATDEFKREHDVATTPQTFIDGKRVGGYTDLLLFLGKPVTEAGATTYTPVLVVVAATLAMALAASHAAYGSPFT